MSQTLKLPLQQAVSTDESFAYFDLGMEKSAQTTLQKITVAQKQIYNNFGVTAFLATDATRFIESLGNTPAISIEVGNIINDTATKILSAFKAETGWVTLRASVPTEEYDVPRWHTDGYFYDPCEGDQQKAALSLKGAATLFSRFPRENFDVLECDDTLDEEQKRLKIADLVSTNFSESVPEGYGAIFTVGSSRAAIHSEPPIHSERLFMSIVPGTVAQIEELRQRCGQKKTTYSLD